MEGIKASVVADDQPIGGGKAATMFGESQMLTEWITPDAIDVKEQYLKITANIESQEDRILRCLYYVASFPYTQFIQATVQLSGVAYRQPDVWLQPSQIMRAPKINCANRSILLTSLLRNEFSPSEVYSVFGNLNIDSQDGHAWNFVHINGRGYMLEPTDKLSSLKLHPVETRPDYEDVIYFNDVEVREIQGKVLRQPFSVCYRCIGWLSDYLDTKYCR